jgi:dipeptidyl-peptidase-4
MSDALAPRSVRAVVAVALSAATAFAQQKTLTLEQTAGPARVNFGGTLASVRFTPDGGHLELKRDGKTVWRDLATGTEAPPSAEDPAAVAAREQKEKARLAAFAALPGFDEAAAKRATARVLSSSADGAVQLFESDGDLFLFRAEPASTTRLTTTPQAEKVGVLSPDGRFVTCVRDSDLIRIDVANGRETRITEDGSAEKLNGILDWVYQEEVFGRGRWTAHFWSPDSRVVAFLSLVQAGVPHHPIVDQADQDPTVEDTRYPKPGDPNPRVAVGFSSVAGGKTTWADLGAVEKEEPIVARVGWTPDAKRAVLLVQDREQTWLDVDLVDPADGKVTTLLRETSPSWVNVLEEPRWLADGSFLWLSERTGAKHLFHYDGGGKLLKQITDGPWEVRAVTDVDEAKRTISFTAGKDGAAAVNLYRVGLDGGAVTRLTQGRGSHAVEWNRDKTRFLDRCSSLEAPPEVRLCDGADGRVLEVVAKSDVPALKEYPYVAPRLLAIPARDGFVMDATLVAPANLEPGKRWPIWLPTYSGPDAPSVFDRWSGDAWPQFLAEHGVAVLQVNNRTSSQNGLACVSKCWKQLGVQELADLEDALQWIAHNEPAADVARVGITGWSYGGFMTAFALTHSKAFKVGIAGAGVYDWRLYDSIYTERYMRLPRNNADGYAKTSAIAAAKDLSGYLVLAHGAIDDNVHFQNTIQFALALQKADRDFEMMVYPRSRHGLSSPEQNWHFRRLTWKTIQERL